MSEGMITTVLLRPLASLDHIETSPMDRRSIAGPRVRRVTYKWLSDGQMELPKSFFYWLFQGWKGGGG